MTGPDDDRRDPRDPRGLRELLESTAPERPDLDHASRVRAVRARSRSRTQRLRLALGGALAAVLGVGIAVPLLAGGTGGVATDPTPDPEVVVVCPDRPVDVDSLPSVTDLPADASSARMCPATATASGVETAGAVDAGTLEPVVANAADLVTALRGLPGGPIPASCATTLAAIDPWAVVIGYPDGSTRLLGGSTRICGKVTVGDREVDVERVLGAFDDAAAAERSQEEGGAEPTRPADAPTEAPSTDRD